MKLFNSKQIAVIMVVVIIASIFIFQYKSSENYDNNQNNLNNYYPEIDSIRIFEEDTLNHDERLQLFKTNNTILFTLYKTCILVNIYNFANIFRWKCIAGLNFILICNYSVFVVLFSNKKDGKKRMQFVFS